ncbi:MAG: family 43 glycosylhydrolase [Bacteroidales bacterium]|nr:family 43 glycosylhydrolase [Bacteroidales bacterium]
MKTRILSLAALALLAATSCNNTKDTSVHQSMYDLNMPIIQTKYTADPSPIVIGDTLYLYTSHDDDHGENFIMKDWLLYTTTDMVNWQDRGAVASLRDFKWYRNNNGAWAQQVVERNGKYYMYCPIHGNGIGVLVSDSPYGPFVDPIGGTLVWQKEHWYDIDPTVWIDDDGQAYMYWGNPNLYYVKLNEDMISYSGDIVELPHIEDYQEGPWFYKRNDKYYLAFASTCCPEGIGYAMSDSPTGPWEYKGHIMDHTHRDRGNHPGIIDYKGKSWCFGQNYDIFRLEESRHAERRSVALAEMHYNEDGTIQEIPYFVDLKIEQVEWFNPYKKVQAETMAWGYGLKTIPKNQWGENRWDQLVTNVDDGEYIKLRGVDFGSGAKSFTVCASALLYGGTIEIRLDDFDGKLVGKVDIGCTKNELTEFTTKIKGAKGVHDLCLVFKASRYQERNLFQLDWWRMDQ